MNKFTPEGKAAIAKILRCMQEAQEAFATLSNEENKACFDFHAEGASLNHCVRWGLTAAEEINASTTSRRDNGEYRVATVEETRRGNRT